jgi:pullulanase/glycogen debranching enzyme
MAVPVPLFLRGSSSQNETGRIRHHLSVPMLLAGDELSQSQKGHNNTDCQHHEVTWLNWDFAEEQ